jgi:hypothetical protein
MIILLVSVQQMLMVHQEEVHIELGNTGNIEMVG